MNVLFEEDGGFKAGNIMADNDSSLQVEMPSGKRSKIKAATVIMRGQWDGIASMEDLLEFFNLLPNPDKTFAVMAGISHASFQQKNYLMVYQILHAYFTQPKPAYTADGKH